MFGGVKAELESPAIKTELMMTKSNVGSKKYNLD